MFGHHDVTGYREFVLDPRRLQRMEEDGYGLVAAEVREPVITTEGEEVEVAVLLVSLQMRWHDGESL